jgi:hypothetical protein
MTMTTTMTSRGATILRVALSAGVLTAAAAAPARAQETVTDVVAFLMTNQAVRTADIERDRNAAETARDTITRALLVNLTAVPIATSSSGFLYRLSPELGTVERATESFGGFFVERALTPGHGRASFGISATTSSFDRLDGLNLRDGSLLTISARFVDEPEAFDTEWLTLRVRSSTMTVLASVGIGDRFEIGGAVPFVRLTLEGERVNVYRGETHLQAGGFAEASGIADAAVRAKYTIAATRDAGLAIAGELRLPTGDADNLLGAGSTAVRVTGIGAVEHGPLTMTGNAGFARGGISNELMFGGATAVALHPRVTLAGEFMARRISELGAIQLSATPHPTIDELETLRLVGGEGGRTISGAILGLKWNPGGTLVLAANLRWSFSDTGLTAPFTPSLAFEYAF